MLPAFTPLEEGDPDGKLKMGTLLCCWTSACFRGCRKDSEKACEGFGKMFWTGQFMTVITVLLFIFAWTVFFTSLAWSETYVFSSSFIMFS